MDLPETISQIAEANAEVGPADRKRKQEELAFRKHSWHERFVDYQQEHKIRIDTPLPELASMLRDKGFKPLFSPEQLDLLYVTACPALDKAKTEELLCSAFLSEWEQYKASISTQHLRRELGKIGATVDGALKVVTIRNAKSNSLLSLATLESYSQLNLGVMNMNPTTKPAVHEKTVDQETRTTSATHAKRTTSDYASETRQKFEIGALWQMRDTLTCQAPLADPPTRISPVSAPKAPQLLVDPCWRLPDSALHMLNSITAQHKGTAPANRTELGAIQSTLEREARTAQKARDTAALFVLQKWKQAHSKWTDSQRRSLLLDKYHADTQQISRLESVLDLPQVDQKLRESMTALSHWMQDRVMSLMEDKESDSSSVDQSQHRTDPLFFRNLYTAQIRLVQWNFLTQCFNELVQGRPALTIYKQEYVYKTVTEWVDQRVVSEFERTCAKSEPLDSEWDQRVRAVTAPWNQFFVVRIPALFEQRRAAYMKALELLRSNNETKLPVMYTSELREYAQSKRPILESKTKHDTRLDGVHPESIDHMLAAVYSWKLPNSSRMFYQYWADLQAAEAYVKLRAKLIQIQVKK